MIDRSQGLTAALALALLAAPAAAALTAGEGYALVRELLSDERKERRQAARRLAAVGDLSLLPAMVDALFFVPRAERGPLLEALETLAGEKPGREYHDWVELVGARTDVTPKEGYAAFKVELLARIDPRYRQILYPGAPARIRLEEVVWGGVRLDGIPALEEPPRVAAAEAGLRDGERVFGVALGGEARAYPLRVLSWHEMANDVVGGRPVTLSYCTLCGSGILYATDTPAGGAYTFGTSGLLYRSNKLMYDRQTYSLWTNLGGEPVVGRRARGDVRLEVLPMTLTTWGEWRRRHPETTALVPDPEAGRRWGFDYRPGAADRARAGVSFPVWQTSDLLARDEEVYALRLDGHPKAYPLSAVLAEGVVNDAVGDVPVVLVGERESGAVRAYRRGGHRFRSGGERDRLVDEDGRIWRLDETALYLEGSGGDGGETEEPLERLPGHVSYWFGWYGFYPTTEVYGHDRR